MGEDEFRDVPFWSRYLVSRSGLVKDKSNGRIIVPTHESRSGTLIVNVQNDRWKWTKTSVARLVLMTYKPCKEDWWYGRSVVRYLDGDNENVHLDNLEWTYKNYIPLLIPGVNCEIDDYVIIPGFGGYTINGLGQHKNSRGDLLSDGYVSDTGYRKVRINNNRGESKSVSVHTLVALTFLEHPLDTNAAGLEVNHKDGDKLNNRFDNLEWVTRPDNIAHAVEMGLVDHTSGKMLAMDVDTRRVTIYATANVCGKTLGIPSTTLRRLATDDRFRSYRGRLFKYERDEREWPAQEDPLLSARISEEIVVLNCVTGLTETFVKVTDVAERLHCTISSIHRHIARDNNVPINNHIVRFNRRGLVWPEFTAADRRRMSASHRWSRRPIVARDLQTLETKEYPSVETFCKEHQLTSAAYIRTKLRRGCVSTHGHELNYL